MGKYTKTVLLILLAGLLLTGCSSKKEEKPLSDNPLPQDDDESLKMEGDSADTPDDETEVPQYDVDLPEELSSFSFSFWGEKYTLPMKCSDFTALGWEADQLAETEIQPQSYLEDVIFYQADQEIYADLVNMTDQVQSADQCYVGGISVDASAKTGDLYMELPGNIVFRISQESDVREVYGAPRDRYEEGSTVSCTYTYGVNREAVLGFEDNMLTQVELKNYSNPEGEQELEDAEKGTTPEVEAYEPPEQLSEELNDFTVLFGGSLYRLPAPVAVFEDNGWELNSEESDEAVAGGEFGYVTLEKDGQKLYTSVYNFGEEPAVASNCFVTSVSGDMDTVKVPITVAGGISLGTAEADFQAFADGKEYEKSEDQEAGTVTYTFYADGSDQDYTEITVDSALGMVRGVKVVCNRGTAVSSEEDTQE